MAVKGDKNTFLCAITFLTSNFLFLVTVTINFLPVMSGILGVHVRSLVLEGGDRVWGMGAAVTPMEGGEYPCIPNNFLTMVYYKAQHYTSYFDFLCVCLCTRLDYLVGFVLLLVYLWKFFS